MSICATLANQRERVRACVCSYVFVVSVCVYLCVCVCVCVYVQGEVDTMIIPSTADWDNSGYAWWDSSSISSGGAGMYV